MDDRELIDEVLSAAVLPEGWEAKMIEQDKEAFLYDDVDELEAKFTRLWEADCAAKSTNSVDLDTVKIPRKRRRKTGDEKTEAPLRTGGDYPYRLCEICDRKHRGKCRLASKRLRKDDDVA